ncbi:MAG: hypothetical protein M3Y90_02175, partial [Actinomycetota bacterium]|nr:hypothetical protein [Actinomycetota bacterium]
MKVVPTAAVMLSVLVVLAVAGLVVTRSGADDIADVGVIAPPSPIPAVVTVSPSPGASGVEPWHEVRVDVTGGTLSDVVLADESNDAVSGV